MTVITVSEAVRSLDGKVSRQAIVRAIRTGRLEALRPFRRFLIPCDSWDRFVRSASKWPGAGHTANAGHSSSKAPADASGPSATENDFLIARLWAERNVKG